LSIYITFRITELLKKNGISSAIHVLRRLAISSMVITCNVFSARIRAEWGPV